MKAKELRLRSTEELQQELQRLKEQLFTLKLERAIGRLENPNRIRQIKRDIARIKTIISERELRGGEGKS